MSGLSKILSGDPGWTGLSALIFYFETQPLPNVLAWYAHHLPDWLLRAGVAYTLLVELLVMVAMTYVIAAVVTSLFGRVWCGFACPQTVFMEGVFRPIERIIEGRRLERIRR